MSWFDPSLLPNVVLVIVAFLVRELVAGLIHAVAQDTWRVVKSRLRHAGHRIAASQSDARRRQTDGACGRTPR